MSGEQITATFDWGQILSILGFSAIVSGAVSTALNYLVTIKQDNKARQLRFLEEKLEIYAAILFHLDEMKLFGDILKQTHGDISQEDLYGYSGNDIDKVIHSINDALEGKLYLFNYEILREWQWVKHYYADERVKEHVSKLRKLVATEYNNSIIPQFRSLVGKDVDKVPL